MTDRNAEICGKIELLGGISDVNRKIRVGRLRTTENVAAIAQSVEESPDLFILRRFLKLGIQKMSLRRILHKDLDVKA